MALSPLTYFSRGVRALTYDPAAGDVALSLAVVAVLAAAFFVVGAYAIPRTD
jgi:ABC-2 type transport system permease protein